MSPGQIVHLLFKERPGGNFVASGYAIDGLIRWIRQIRPKSVLEVGAGIGTLTSVIVPLLEELHGNGGYRLVSIESEPFCLQQLDANLGQGRCNVTVVNRYEDIPSGFAPFDMVIVDGCGPYPEDGNADPEFVRRQNELFVSELAPRGVVFVEKDRQRQREIFAPLLQHRPQAYCHFQPWTVRPGYHLFRLEPTSGEARRLRLREAIGVIHRRAKGFASRLRGNAPRT